MRRRANTIVASGVGTVLGSILGFVVAQGLSFYQFSKNLKNTNKIEQIHLLRDLTSQFWGGGADPVYRGIRTGIDSCARLYSGDLGFAKSTKGNYDYDQINRYLGFFDDIGFYEGQSAIELSMINHSFGVVIIEAYEYPELRKYVDDMQRHEPRSFNNFQIVARKLEDLPENHRIAEMARNSCKDHR
jgi:hypothetical protein